MTEVSTQTAAQVAADLHEASTSIRGRQQRSIVNDRLHWFHLADRLEAHAALWPKVQEVLDAAEAWVTVDRDSDFAAAEYALGDAVAAYRDALAAPSVGSGETT